MEGNFPFTLRVKAFGIYLFALFIIYLAGSYLSSFFLFLFYFLLFSPLVSLLYLFIVYSRIKYHQDFSTEHPVKGQAVSYRLSVANESFLPIHYMKVRFKSIHPLMKKVMPDFFTYIKGNGLMERMYQIHCPFRGIYTVGLEGIELEDLLHLFRMNRPVWYRTFYVYPRVLFIKRFSSGIEKGERKAQGSSEGAFPDYSLFTQLKGYRSGDSLRHIYWKKFASTGVPFLKEYETTAEPGVTIYFDLRRGMQKGIKGLEIEDTSIEILVALVKFFLDRGLSTEVRAAGRSLYTFRGENSLQFTDFYKSTFELLFQETFSPSRLYEYERKSGIIESPSVIFISHIVDSELFALLEESLGKDNRVTVVFNQTGYTDRERKRILHYFNLLRDRGGNILVVNGSHSIVEDLEGALRG